MDPCAEAAKRSIRCLNRNGGNKAMCQDYFEYVTLSQQDEIQGRTDPLVLQSIPRMQEDMGIYRPPPTYNPRPSRL